MLLLIYFHFIYVINRPGVAGAVLKKPLSFIHSFIHSLIEWYFSSKSATHHYTQFGKARQLKFWEGVHSTPRVACHKLHVTWHVWRFTFHMSRVTYHVSTFFFLLFFLLLFLRQSGGLSLCRVCYQQGLHVMFNYTQMNRTHLSQPQLEKGAKAPERHS